MSVDPATLEILKNRFQAIANQMTLVVMRSAYSTIIKEMKDVSSSIFDSDIRLIAEGANVPIHLNMLKPCLESIFSYHIDIHELQPGDVILTNDPYIGKNDESKGSHHTNDLVTIVPVFYRDELICLSTIVGHHRDVGGNWPGTRGWNVEIWQEGLRIKPVKLYRAGKLNKDILDLILNNTRVPYDMEGDLQAQISGCEFGRDEIIKVFERYGVETVKDVINELMIYSEKRTRAEIEKIPDGTYENEEFVLDDGAYGGPFKLKVKITVRGSDIEFDYSGTDRQIEGPINAPWAATYSATHYVMRCLTDPTIPTNDGCSRPIKIIAPEGTLVNCKKPAACYQRMVVCHLLVDLIMGALKDAVPEKVMAGSCGCIYNFASAVNTKTHPFGGETGLPRQRWGEVVPSGLGARSYKDGISVLSCHVTNVPIPPIEASEIEAPVLYLKREFNPNSAGPGKFRGGFGLILKWKTLGEGKSTRFNYTAQKHKIKPKGLFGGLSGRSGRWVINEGKENEIELPYSIGDTYILNYGDTVTLYAVGGGGYGDPLERDPEKVLSDVRNELISAKDAFKDYGVVIDPISLKLDEQATRAERLKRLLARRENQCSSCSQADQEEQGGKDDED